VLVRDYQGQHHSVTVARNGFDWQGATYPSLSAIARAITGTAWSGPRFGLAPRTGTPTRSNVRGDDNSPQGVHGMNSASLPLQSASHAEA
jgi:Protein of unknown function (DUF2924)